MWVISSICLYLHACIYYLKYYGRLLESNMLQNRTTGWWVKIGIANVHRTNRGNWFKIRSNSTCTLSCLSREINPASAFRWRMGLRSPEVIPNRALARNAMPGVRSICACVLVWLQICMQALHFICQLRLRILWVGSLPCGFWCTLNCNIP